MSALVNALDNTTSTNKSIGENGHAEYSWSSSTMEKILQFTFQSVRTDAATIQKLKAVLTDILKDIKTRKDLGTITDGLHCELLCTLYKTIGHTRDIIDGKGEYAHAFMQIVVWYEFYPDLAKFAFKKFVINFDEHPYGSWKDIKYFCEYCKNCGMETSHPLIQYAFTLVNRQLTLDIADHEEKRSISLAAKWIPREGKHFGWIFYELAKMHFKDYLLTAKDDTGYRRATTKCYRDYRRLLSSLNRYIDTVQIKQCGGQWAEIDHSKTTSITLAKQKKAFLNVDARGHARSQLVDRVKCADNFKERVRSATKEGGVEMKGKRTGLNAFAADAITLVKRRGGGNVSEELQCEIDLINSQWKDNGVNTSTLRNIISMVDFSGSMEGDPLHCAMALGCRVAEKSILGRRVLSFSTNPTWHNLDGRDNFVDMIEVLMNGEIGYATCFYTALKVILNAIIEQKLPPDEVSGLTLAIFSDMQINQADNTNPNMDSLYERIELMYAEAGMRLHGKAFTPPHILFWNLRSTGGFPSMSSQKNVSMMSGFSPALLNQFCEKGVDSIADSCTPWTQLFESMNKPRYQCLEDKIKQQLV